MEIIVSAKLYYPICKVAHRVQSLAGLPVMNIQTFHAFHLSHPECSRRSVHQSVRPQTSTGVAASCYSVTGVGRTANETAPSSQMIHYTLILIKFHTCVGKVPDSGFGLLNKLFVIFLCHLPEKTGKAVPLCFYSQIPVPGTNLASYGYGPSKSLATSLTSTLK
jgi:hypothetical protein